MLDTAKLGNSNPVPVPVGDGAVGDIGDPLPPPVGVDGLGGPPPEGFPPSEGFPLPGGLGVGGDGLLLYGALGGCTETQKVSCKLLY